MQFVNFGYKKEWVIHVQHQERNFSATYYMLRTSYFRWDDNDGWFVLGQHVQLDFYTASSLKWQSTGRHVTLLNNCQFSISVSYCTDENF